jgi:1A family penicillin-binding protein
MKKIKKWYQNRKKHVKNLTFSIIGFGAICIAALVVWISLIDLPDFKAFEERKSLNSTKIYDKTGEVVLYDTNKNVRRTEIPYENMGENIKHATVAIEDQKFYEHNGVRVSSFIRAMYVNLVSGSFSQGGSTITQQVVKNTLLNPKKTITRKIKEWVLAIKLERILTKDEILAIYLNDAPYGGTIYGIEEAAHSFFDKDPIDLTLAEAAYLAAIPQAPSYFSPYGSHREALDSRKNLVLSEMKSMGYVTEEEYTQATAEEVVFLQQSPKGIKAPHFVFYIEQYLEEKYGREMLDSGGLKVITSLDWELQEKAEEIVNRRAFENESAWNASNQALVAVDPKTGQIVTMVGSRDYFDKEIDGNFNIATALRQPGSSFKPFVYATAFKEGYTPDTVLFDVPTEFQATCSWNGYARPGYSQSDCYSPGNYDGKYLGPITLRNALGQSRNVPAVQLLYLAGVADSIKTARDLGISTLTDPERYGLTLVLGGGEVTLLDMVSGYGVFANEGIQQPTTGILRVEDKSGNVLEEYTPKPNQVLDRNVALTISDILSDNVARTPLFGSNSFLYFGGRDIAGKTGTTNSNRDAWLVGYSPSIAVGVWSGNNDNTPMKKGSSISGPAWREYMDLAIAKYPSGNFPDPIYDYKEDTSVKPILRGVWQGGQTYVIDTVSGKLATEFTPLETREERVITSIHTTLHWVDKNDPRGPTPSNPGSDSQYENWEASVQNWWNENKYLYGITEEEIPTEYDDVHTGEDSPVISFDEVDNKIEVAISDEIDLKVKTNQSDDVEEISFSLDGKYLGKDTSSPFTLSFSPIDADIGVGNYTLTATAIDNKYNKGYASITINVVADDLGNN